MGLTFRCVFWETAEEKTSFLSVPDGEVGLSVQKTPCENWILLFSLHPGVMLHCGSNLK